MKEKLPTIDIKGKEYVLVKDRITYFNETFPNGAIITEQKNIGEDVVNFKATVYPDVTNKDRYFTGHSEEIRGGNGVNATSAVENAETSAVGRALAMLGIGVVDSVASGDEVIKAQNRGQALVGSHAGSNETTSVPTRGYAGATATEKQKAFIKKLCFQKGQTVPTEAYFTKLTLAEARKAIDKLLAMPEVSNEGYDPSLGEIQPEDLEAIIK